MSTLPPSGLAPTLPPPPHERARRAAFFALAGLALLVAALTSLRLSHADAAILFAYDNDRQATLFMARMAFGFSLAAQIAATHDVGLTWKWRQHRSTTMTALGVTGVWLAAVLWVAIR